MAAFDYPGIQSQEMALSDPGHLNSGLRVAAAIASKGASLRVNPCRAFANRNGLGPKSPSSSPVYRNPDALKAPGFRSSGGAA
jgi:hypothetical protein